MALFTNYATLSYGGRTLTSNTVSGELLETVSASKTAASETYVSGGDVTYVISLINSGTEAVTGLTVTDDLGGYTFGTGTVYPLAYRAGSLRLFVNGVLQTAPAVTAGPPLTVSGVAIPAGGNAELIYEASVTGYAPLDADGSITNTATVTGGGLSVPVTASAAVTPLSAAELTISKALSPAVARADGQLTYTFVIENTGTAGVASGENAVVEDTFNPVLSALTVTLNGAPWSVGTNYTYDEATGAFATLPGQLAVPAATVSQHADGTWGVVPGTAELVVTGTVGAVT